MNDCVHFWIIEDAIGPVSMGRCKHCKAKRVFCNTIGGVIQ